MKIKVEIELEAHTAEYVASISEATGTPVQEVLAAIINGHKVMQS